jgi:hypothetical protein
MKILYASDYNEILHRFGCPNDYMNDVLFHGLTELEDVEVVDSTRMDHLYKSHKDQFPTIYGRGFTTSYLLDDRNIDRSNLEEKIRDKYFDYIIYGSISRTRPYYDIVSSVYPDNKIAAVDGDDSDAMCLTLQPFTRHFYFKRELIRRSFLLGSKGFERQIFSISSECHPINFAIPEEKIRAEVNPNPKNDFAQSIPYHDSGYRFETEQSYYDDYYNSIFGITMKKAGWDCMRHYEIMANGCLPLFMNLDNCPDTTMTSLDRDLMRRCNNAINDYSAIPDLRAEVLEFTKNNLTTKQLAKYVLETIVS